MNIFLIYWRAISFFIQDQGGCRSQTTQLVRESLGIAGLKAFLTAFEVAVTGARYEADLMRLKKPDGAFDIETSSHDLIGCTNLLDANRQGRGTIIACSFFSCFFHAFIAEYPTAAGNSFNRLNVVVPQGDHILRAILENIARISGRTINCIEMGSSRAGLDFVKALKRNEFVVCMIDNIPKDATVAVCDFFGQPSCMPAGFIDIAIRNSVPILVAGTLYESGRYLHWFSPPIQPSASATSPHAIANAINEQLETVIRRHPGSWSAWYSIKSKRDLGLALQELG